MPLPSKAKRVLQVIAGAAAILSALCLIGSVPVVNSYANKAQLIQRVQVDKSSGDLFGDGSNEQPIGSPQQLIIEDPKAFIKDKDGVKRVDEAYLNEHKIYPLQLQSVYDVARYVRFVAGIVLLAGLVLVAMTRTKKQTD